MQNENASSDSGKRLIFFALCTVVFTCVSACSNQGEKARLAVQEYLKNQAVQDVKLDLFATSPSLPGKAYVSVTVTHSFANAEGGPQLEYLGYILMQDGQEWRVDKNTSYTKEEQRARDLLAGGK